LNTCTTQPVQVVPDIWIEPKTVKGVPWAVRQKGSVGLQLESSSGDQPLLGRGDLGVPEEFLSIKIFKTKRDREDFLDRLAKWAVPGLSLIVSIFVL
jgi:hypothetical protein